MESYADDNLPVTWILMHDNDPNHIARSVKFWLEEDKTNFLEWPPQSLNLNLELMERYCGGFTR